MKKMLVFSLFLITINGFSQPDFSKNFNVKRGVAIDGYDPVSYFTDEPKMGRKYLNATYNEVTYWFASDKNLEKFNMQPEKYEPEYGGWCAYAMGASGDKVKIDPYTYKIINAKLYLFYNFGSSNTLDLWNDEEKSLKDKADRNWKEIVN